MPEPTTTSALIPEQTKNKIVYIDHLKIVLTVLVILHHTFITYGASGGWYYTQKTTHTAALIPMTMFVAVNQAFFMGFFFLLSALFIPSSYNKKGQVRFLTDRLLRLGVPLLFYSFVFSPFINYLIYYFGYQHHISYLQYLGGFDDWIDFGVLWFVAALLLFTMLYLVWRVFNQKQNQQTRPAPTAAKILLFAASLGIMSFLIRIIFPVGWVLKPVGFQLGHFPQYIALFVIGLIASQKGWLNTLDYKIGKQLGILAIGMILFIFPIFYILKVKLNFPLEWFSGGLHWQSLLYALWEQITGLSIVTALICTGKRYWNKSSAFSGRLSRYTFAVYIFHPLVIISLSLMIRNWAVDPAFKLLVVAPTAVIFSFLLASVTVLIPGVKRII